MKIAKCTGSQEHWYVTTRKPTICPNCGEKLRHNEFELITSPRGEDNLMLI